MAPQEFANQLLQGGNLPAVIADVRRNKALATLLERATVTDASGRPVDLAALTADPTAIAEAGEDLEDDDDIEDDDIEDDDFADTEEDDAEEGAEAAQGDGR
jgi:trigger factor